MPDREPLYVLTTDDLVRLVQDIRSGAADDLAAYLDSHAVHWLTTQDATGRPFDLVLLWDLTRSQRPAELVP